MEYEVNKTLLNNSNEYAEISKQSMADSIGCSRQTLHNWFTKETVTFEQLEAVSKESKILLPCYISVNGLSLGIYRFTEWKDIAYHFDRFLDDALDRLKCGSAEFKERYNIKDVRYNWLLTNDPKAKTLPVKLILDICNDAQLDLNNYIFVDGCEFLSPKAYYSTKINVWEDMVKSNEDLKDKNLKLEEELLQIKIEHNLPMDDYPAPNEGGNPRAERLRHIIDNARRQISQALNQSLSLSSPKEQADYLRESYDDVLNILNNKMLH